MELEFQLNTTLEKYSLSGLVANDDTRPHFLKFVENCIRIAAKRNTTLTTNTEPIPTQPTQSSSAQTQTQTLSQLIPMQYHLLENGEIGSPGLTIKGVATFMDDSTERLGICFCNARRRNTVTISPGLALLLKGSNFRATMRKKVFEALAEVTVADHRCRIVRIKNKVIALFVTGDDATEFAQACSLLSTFGREEDGQNSPPRKISVDAMVVAYEKAEARDYMGVVRASKNHRVVVYEDRGQNLSHLRPYRPDIEAATQPIDSWGHPIGNPEDLSGSERLQHKTAEAKEERLKQQRQKPPRDVLRTVAGVMSSALQSIVSRPQKGKVDKARTSERNPTKKRDKTIGAMQTKADKGLVEPPELVEPGNLADHLSNAFLEYKAVLRATLAVKKDTCKSILQTFNKGNERQLQMELEESDAAVYDNNTSRVLRGNMTGQYMAAYNSTSGFVTLNEETTRQTERLVFETPQNDPIVVVAKCTKVMLEERILEMAESLSGKIGTSGASIHQVPPKITWINGVPGCGKTTWVINNIKSDEDIVTTATTEALRDMREKLAPKMGAAVNTRVRTMASLLVNGQKGDGVCNRVIIDEALMSHFGAVVMAAKLTGAAEVLLLGDYNQLPYIDRDNLFVMKYTRPNLATKITQELLCTRRNPLDVAYVLNEIYSGIFSAVPRVRSLSLETYEESQRIPKQPNTLYLVHTQLEKLTLIDLGFDKVEGSQVHTIHEAQGLTFKTVIIVRTTKKKTQLHSSVSHAVVAITRHTHSCVYYTAGCEDDATARFIQRALSATTSQIKDYNINMAIRSRNLVVADSLLEVGGGEVPAQ